MMGDKTILLVDDERQIRRLIGAALSRAGYTVIEADDGRTALSLAASRKPDAALIDLGLPDRDGLELVSSFAAKGDMTIIVVSARDATDEKISALDLGADDYVTKPFDTDELLARLRAALRRRQNKNGSEQTASFGDIAFDPETRTVRRNGNVVHLTPKEYALFALLAQSAGRVLTHAHLLRTIWGAAHESDIEYLRVTARALRLKLEDNPSRPTLIRNEPGVGYRLTRD
jgi:two-component system KDP operon response regulator KdpE